MGAPIGESPAKLCVAFHRISRKCGSIAQFEQVADIFEPTVEVVQIRLVFVLLAEGSRELGWKLPPSAVAPMMDLSSCARAEKGVAQQSQTGKTSGEVGAFSRDVLDRGPSTGVIFQLPIEIQRKHTTGATAFFLWDKLCGHDLEVLQVMVEPLLFGGAAKDEHAGGWAGIRVVVVMPGAKGGSQIVDVLVDSAASNELKEIGFGIAHAWVLDGWVSRIFSRWKQ
ncbi:hypothetical protein C405_08205 [Stenotrophomonas maltophilia AU12-09]|nr:hypothetical protein C405_08205 [Stenotrophomonas maltophilia AU12-09]